MHQPINYREINKAVMDDTMKMCGQVDSLKKSIDNSITNEYVVYQSELLTVGDLQINPDMKVLVSKNRTFEAAEAYKGKKICCLDFANYYSMGHPGLLVLRKSQCAAFQHCIPVCMHRNKTSMTNISLKKKKAI